MEYILTLTSLSAIFLVLIFLFFISINNFLKNKTVLNEKRLFMEKVDKFSSYLAVLEHYMNLAYQIIYNERIMVYSMEATKLPTNELNAAAKDYINLTLKFLGPSLEKEFSEFYGSYETLYFVIGQNFFMKYEDDEIRKASTSNMMEFENDYSESE